MRAWRARSAGRFGLPILTTGDPGGWHRVARVEGVRYFRCEAKHGAFVRPSAVTVGDFPEEDFNFSDDDEM